MLFFFQAQSFNFATAQQVDSIKIPHSSSNSPIKSGLLPYMIPAAFMGYGMITLGNNALRRFDHHLQNSIDEAYPNFSTKTDNYLQFSPAAAVYGLNATGLKGKNNFRDRTMIYVMANTIMEIMVYTGKTTTLRLRPDGSANTSFPSGHTATAFVGAEFFYQEYKDVSPWYGIAGYTLATTTGALRMYNNKHWFSDVVAGASVGIISTKLSYLAYPTIERFLFKKGTMNTVLVPTYQNQNIELYYAHNFNL